MNTSHITTRAEILRRCQNRKGGITQLSKETGIPYADLYDAKHCRPMSIARENGVRRKLNLSPRPAAPMQRVTIDPTTEGVRKLPGHGDTPYRTMAVKMSAADYDMLMSKFARIGCKSLQDYVDTVMLENGSEAA